MLLLAVIYYLTNGIYLLDASVSSLSAAAATALSIGVLLGGWLAYEAVWRSPLARGSWPAALVSMMLFGVVIFVLFRTLSGRAAFIHVGALLGTIMVANVWVIRGVRCPK
jgi:uncharacterized membrane protein